MIIVAKSRAPDLCWCFWLGKEDRMTHFGEWRRHRFEAVKKLWNKLLTTAAQRTEKKGAFLCASVVNVICFFTPSS
jgi:hypothetical protein